MSIEYVLMYAFVAVIIVLGIRRYRIWKDEDFGDRED